jgi:hypothetical protein
VATRGWERPVQIAGVRQCRRGPGARLCCVRFVFLGSVIICRLYKLTRSAQAQVTLRLRFSLFDIFRNMVRPCWEGGGGGAKIFNRVPNPLLAGSASAVLLCSGCALYCVAAYRTAMCSERGTKLNKAENCVLLCNYLKSSCNSVQTFRDNLSIPFPKTLVRNYQYSLRNNP